MNEVPLRDDPRGDHRFVDFPEPIDPTLYEEAADRYVRAVSSRAVSIYRGGSVRFPGLSDIDMLVVVDRPAWDNDQFFSPFVRLPQRYHALFQHRPHFVPASHVDALKYSTFAYRPRHRVAPDNRLVHGADVLPFWWPALDTSWYWCCLFEAATSFRTTIDKLEAKPNLSVRRFAGLAVTLRYPLQQLDELTRASFAPAFSQAIDRARAELLSPAGDRYAAAAAVHTRLLDALGDFERRLLQAAGLSPTIRAIDAARDVLAGRHPIRGLDAAYVIERRAMIFDYLEALRHMRLSGMSVFVTAPYRGDVTLYRQSAPARVIATMLHRMGVSSLV